MNLTERAFIIIDGSNFYHRLKELRLSSLLNFNYAAFSKFLLGQKRKLVKQCYYIGAIREEHNNPKSKTLMIHQQKLISHLKQQAWEISLGHMLKTNGYQEKGVDVQIAVDVLIGAYENLYDTLILVSSDTDLIPALKKSRDKKKKVEYIGFSHKPSYALISHSDIRRLLIKEEVARFIKFNNHL
ncbi:MAG: NYN domain-containing protein [Candidatus Jacksonbacteria bacterium]